MFKYWGPFMRVLSGGLTGAFVFQTISAALTWRIRLGIAVGGAVLGMILFQLLIQQLTAMVKRQSPQEFLVKIFSLFLGIFFTSLLIAVLRPVIGYMLPLQSGLAISLLVLLSIHIFSAINSVKSKELSALFFNNPNSTAPKPNPGANPLKILDTSAIIDGRIADLCKTNFIEGGLIIPSFVLTELQKIADSPDPLRRNRGRRGLDLLNKIQKENQITVKIFDRDYEELNEVDTKLLRLAMELGAKVVTNDFNLNKVAELYGVPVLNINELSNAIKPVVLPGEEMAVHVLRDGKEYGQGIGYLEDGTMIVVEGGKSYIGMDIEILVTSVLQTSAGRMIFAKPRDYALTRISS